MLVLDIGLQSNALDGSYTIDPMKLIQIVPGLFPRVDGIGDYALQLARRLREDHDIVTSFVVADPDWIGGDVEGFSAIKLRSRSPSSFLDAVNECDGDTQGDPSPILLQFSPYGYEKRGYPLWLQKTIEGWPKVSSSPIHVAYHELEVSGRPPWSSAFWVPPLQRNLIKRITQVSAFQYTNCEDYRFKLEHAGSGRITLIPNFSTIGEPAVNPRFAERERNVVVFGRGAQREMNYRFGMDALLPLCKAVNADRIIDIGAPIAGHAITELGGIPIVRCGRLDAEDVNKWMATSIASFIAYPVPLLTKSSVHAVSCANGTIPFVFDHQAKELSCPGLVADEDFVSLRRHQETLNLPPLEELSATVHRNYLKRDSHVAALTIARHIFKNEVFAAR